MDGAATLNEWINTHTQYEGINLLKKATAHIMTLDKAQAAYVASPFLNLFGVIAGHIALQKQMEVIEKSDNPDYIALKKETADFYKKNILPRANMHFAIVMQDH